MNSELSPSPTPDGGTQPTTDPAYSGGSPPRVAGADTPSGYVDTPPRAAGPATGAPTLRLPPAPPPGLPTLPELGSTTAPTPPTAPAELPPTLPLPEGTGLDQLSSELFTIFAKDFLLHPFATPYEDQAAAQPSGLGSAPLAVPNSWNSLLAVLHRLGYHPSVKDPWGMLGLSAYDGPAPEAYLIQARARAALLLLDLRLSTSWPAQDLQPAQEAAEQFSKAQTSCLAVADSTLSMRRKIVPAKISGAGPLGTAVCFLLRHICSPSPPLHTAIFGLMLGHPSSSGSRRY